MKRSSGILLAIYSLPSPYGIGTLGHEAYRFVDFLVSAGQSYWQVLPVGPTGYGDSPYLSFSTFGGNPYFIDLGMLMEDGLLRANEVRDVFWGQDPSEVDYGLIYENRWDVLKKAFHRGYDEHDTDLKKFVADQEGWLHEYALYMAIKQHFGMKSWQEWPDDKIRRGEDGAKIKYASLLREQINFHIYLQFLFFTQWDRLRKYANMKGVGIIGDLPYYVPLDSADVWGKPHLFNLNENRIPVSVGGVPPDDFSESGQLWGNPLYDWGAMKEDGYNWWWHRMRAMSYFFDGIRIDHFRGIESYWEIPWGSLTAVEGQWKTGPGMELIRILQQAGDGLLLIAEDLGFLTPPARKLQKDSGFPCMKILQFAFDGRPDNEYLPHNYERNCVAYTGTHDNDTILGWWNGLSPGEKKSVIGYFGISDEKQANWEIIRGGMGSVANLFIAQMQDYLKLGSDARMNVPGTGQGNWKWRLVPSQLNQDIAEKIREYTWIYGRL
ncbi:MAG: 4-alpha-glucanotransferase [Anaerovoracaceae bacterium]|jgi:4-alpha-glucanotransferase